MYGLEKLLDYSILNFSFHSALDVRFFPPWRDWTFIFIRIYVVPAIQHHNELNELNELKKICPLSN